MRTTAITLLVFFIVACNSDNMPTSPTPIPPVVGSWKYAGEGFSDTIKNNVQAYALSQGIGMDMADV